MKKRIKVLLIAFTLVFSVSATSIAYASGRSMSEDEIMRIATKVGGQYEIAPEFLASIAYYESRWNPDAGNGSCKGLMQVSERWHKSRMRKLGVSNLKDPYGNMLVAADYLSELFSEYEDPGVVLMKYNGDSRAEKFRKGNTSISKYAENVLEKSMELERKHGK